MLSVAVCEANVADENRSFIFTVCVKSVLLYHFKASLCSSTVNVDPRD